MATRWLASFDTPSFTSEYEEVDSGSVSGVTLEANADAGRNGTLGLRIARTSNNTNNSYIRKWLDAQSTWTQGFAHKRIAGIKSHTLSRVLDAGTEQVSLWLLTTGALQVKRGSTTLGTSTDLLVEGQQVYIEWKVVINNSTGSVEVRVNGTAWLTLSSIDTQNTANATGDRVELGYTGGSLSGLDVGWDDWYVNDGTGSTHNGFEGDKRVCALAVTANGAAGVDFTPLSGTNAENVDDDGTADDDTSYNASATVGDKDFFAVEDLPASATGAPVVALKARWRKDDAGARSLRTLIKSSSSEAQGATVAMNTTYATHTDIVDEDPATSAAWTVAGVNAMQPGYEVVT